MEYSEIVRERRSIKHYDPEAVIGDPELKEIFEEVILSPSSFNLQHWMFIAVRDPELKKKIKEAAWNQKQLEECSVTLAICGKLDAHRDAAPIWKDTPKNVQDFMISAADKFYEGQDQLCRDEAVRSASLAAMALMFSAQNRGYHTGPIIGFDPVAVTKLLRLTANFFPVMLITLGKSKEEPKPRTYRHPVEEIVRLDTLDGPGLA